MTVAYINVAGIKNHLPEAIKSKGNWDNNVPILSKKTTSIFSKIQPTLPLSNESITKVTPTDNQIKEIERGNNQTKSNGPLYFSIITTAIGAAFTVTALLVSKIAAPILMALLIGGAVTCLLFGPTLLMIELTDRSDWGKYIHYYAGQAGESYQNMTKYLTQYRDKLRAGIDEKIQKMRTRIDQLNNLHQIDNIDPKLKEELDKRNQKIRLKFEKSIEHSEQARREFDAAIAFYA